jgi:hypothetical protein
MVAVSAARGTSSVSAALEKLLASTMRTKARMALILSIVHKMRKVLGDYALIIFA